MHSRLSRRLLLSALLLAACSSHGTSSGDGGPEGPDPGVDASSPGEPAPADPGPTGDFAGYAASAAGALHGYYNSSTGLWNTTGWWNSANALTAVVNYEIATGDTAYTGDIATTFATNKSGNFLNNYYDDEGWWALAWIRAYDLTGNADYLAMAKTIFDDMAQGWSDTCGGGLTWTKTPSGKNAIPNELFLSVAAALHTRTAGDAGPGSYLDWAQREWTWFERSGMINGDDLINDGLGSDCKNNGGTTWTYNQGVILGGLVELAAATGDAALTARATAIAHAAMDHLSESHGVLHEPCEPSCGGDGTQFKGIFMRNLAAFQQATGDERARVFLAENADWLWNADQDDGGHFGLTWTGAFDQADASRQSSALDAFNAAIPFTEPADDLALGLAVTANGRCTDTEVAANAVDGDRASKWCAGASDGHYWLDVDLGAPTEIGRVILRHAAAGGEKAGDNTRDFSLDVDDGRGGGLTAVAKVTGNTLGVTIHRFAPVRATRVRLDITNPQTDPQYIAARIYELELYPR